MTGSKEENVIMSPVFVKVLLTLLAEAAGQTVGSETRTVRIELSSLQKTLKTRFAYFLKFVRNSNKSYHTTKIYSMQESISKKFWDH